MNGQQLDLDLSRPSLKEILIAQIQQAKDAARSKVLAYLARGVFKQRTHKGGLRS